MYTLSNVKQFSAEDEDEHACPVHCEIKIGKKKIKNMKVGPLFTCYPFASHTHSACIIKVYPIYRSNVDI